MIQVICDNCNRMLRNSADESGADAEPSGSISLIFDGKRLFERDLCPRCSKWYLQKLQKAISNG